MRKEDYLLQGQSTERDREMLKFDQICNNIMVIPQQQKSLDAELLEFGGFSVGTRRCQKSHEHQGGEERKGTLLVILLHLELLIIRLRLDGPCMLSASRTLSADIQRGKPGVVLLLTTSNKPPSCTGRHSERSHSQNRDWLKGKSSGA